MEEGEENEKNAGGMKEDKSGKEGSFMPIIIVMLASVLIASFWNSLPFIKNSVGAILDPTAGFLLGWNITLGMTAILIVLSFLLTLAQKYMTDQETLREIEKIQGQSREDDGDTEGEHEIRHAHDEAEHEGSGIHRNSIPAVPEMVQ
jgi:hypothetical protein